MQDDHQQQQHSTTPITSYNIHLYIYNDPDTILCFDNSGVDHSKIQRQEEPLVENRPDPHHHEEDIGAFGRLEQVKEQERRDKVQHEECNGYHGNNNCDEGDDSYLKPLIAEALAEVSR